jgi:hypothetical protein
LVAVVVAAPETELTVVLVVEGHPVVLPDKPLPEPEQLVKEMLEALV